LTDADVNDISLTTTSRQFSATASAIAGFAGRRHIITSAQQIEGNGELDGTADILLMKLDLNANQTAFGDAGASMSHGNHFGRSTHERQRRYRFAGQRVPSRPVRCRWKRLTFRSIQTGGQR